MNRNVFLKYCCEQTKIFFEEVQIDRPQLYTKLLRYCCNKNKPAEYLSKQELRFITTSREYTYIEDFYSRKNIKLREHMMDFHLLVDCKLYVPVSQDYISKLCPKQKDLFLNKLFQQMQIFESDVDRKNFLRVVNNSLSAKLPSYVMDNQLRYEQLTAQEILSIPNILPGINRIIEWKY